MRTPLCFALLLTLLMTFPASTPAMGASTPGPVKVILFDGCDHAVLQQAIARSRSAVALEINSSAIDLEACQIDPVKAQGAITALARRLDVESRAALRRGEPAPVTIVYTGSFLEGTGVVGSWSKALKSLAKVALIVSPGGNDSRYGAAEVWPSSLSAFKVGLAPGGALTGSVGKVISIYVDYDAPLEVVIGNTHYFASGSSTAAMLASVHLANVLATGTGQKYNPTQLLKKLKGAFKEQIIAEGDLEARFAAALR